MFAVGTELRLIDVGRLSGYSPQVGARCQVVELHPFVAGSQPTIVAWDRTDSRVQGLPDGPYAEDRFEEVTT